MLQSQVERNHTGAKSHIGLLADHKVTLQQHKQATQRIISPVCPPELPLVVYY